MNRPATSNAPVASIVIPAHNEESTIGRLLESITHPDAPARFEVVVACNGCVDRTADIARQFDVTVLDIPEAGKLNAMRQADVRLTVFPRIYLDADVEMSAGGLVELATALEANHVLAAGPRRIVPRQGLPWHVRAYYDVWESLPSVRAGLFGRGAIALSRAGVERVHGMPWAMSDDLMVSEAFAPGERAVAERAEVTVHAPRTWRDLVRRRSRVVTGNRQADDGGIRGTAARTSLRTLATTVVSQPRLAVKLPVFLAVTVESKVRARRAVRAKDYTTWERDESSRRAPRP